MQIAAGRPERYSAEVERLYAERKAAREAYRAARERGAPAEELARLRAAHRAASDALFDKQDAEYRTATGLEA